jgi:hypothetical protein
MTRHQKEWLVVDGPLTEEDLNAVRAMLRPRTEWAWLEREVRIAQNTLDAIEKGERGEDGDDIFLPRHGVGWYSQQILRCAWRIAEGRNSADIHEVAVHSFDLAMFLTEMRMKRAWEHDVEAALNTEEGRQRGGGANRKGLINVRLARFDQLRSQGVQKMEAYRRIAEEEGSTSFTTVGDAIRRARKKIQ